MNKSYDVNSIVVMKKNHPCGSNKWQILRTGVDIKLKCLGCGHVIMISRLDFERMLKKVEV